MEIRAKDEKFQRGLRHFNAREFFEAHEVWEEIWLVEAEPEKTFLQGLIQLAAAFHHYCRGNPAGAESLLAAGIVKLSRFSKHHCGLEIEALRASAKEWARALGAGQMPAAHNLPRITLRSASAARRKHKPQTQRKGKR